jgi:hypothetical protein
MNKRVVVAVLSAGLWSCAGGDASDAVDQASAAVELPPPPTFEVSAVFSAGLPVAGSTRYCPPGFGCPSGPPVQVRWGDPASTGALQSGLGFQSTAPATIVLGTPFALGTLTHFNQPVYNALTSVDLDLGVKVTPQGGGTPLFERPVQIHFTINETPNDAPACPHDAIPCDDHIFLTGNAPQSATVTIGDVIYEFTLLGFLDESGSLETEFISPETGSNHAQLYAVFNQRCTDDDGDGVCNVDDNCVSSANDSQLDSDGDGAGDACDACPLDAANDADGDGVCGNIDNCVSTANTDQANADGDALGDACDACPADAANDADGDGVCGDVDNCPLVANGGQANSDGDALGDACDACPLDAANDADGDGVCGNADNCPLVANNGQANADGDALGDACDACPLDAANDVDHDGVCGNLDNCPLAANTTQADSDGDGAGDVCDVCPLDAANDVDHDGVCGNLDNCPVVANAGQANADGDAFGDACDVCVLDAGNDADHDGVCGNVDRCPGTTSGPVDANGCAIAQLCPCEGAWNNHGQYVSCVAHAANDFLAAGLITAAQRGQIQSAAGQSSCGH